MNFVEEKTPSNIIIKILFDRWQFLAFDVKGKSIYADKEGRTLLHDIPVIIFIGVTFKRKQGHQQTYSMLKIRDGNILVPYIDKTDGSTKYFFLQTDKKLDCIPARIMQVNDVVQLLKEVEPSPQPCYVAVDDGITANDVIIVKNRYNILDIVYIEIANNHFLAEKLQIPDMDRIMNLNMMSANPVFLANIHLRAMDLSKINQLLLDFEITALDTEYILEFLRSTIRNDDKDPRVEKNMHMLQELLNSFCFYLALIQKNEDEIKKMIDALTSVKEITPLRTLVSKVKSMFPGSDDQIRYTEFENMLMDRLQSLGS
jgi:hypothetical protein